MLKMSELKLLSKQQSANQTTQGLNLACLNMQGVRQKESRGLKELIRYKCILLISPFSDFEFAKRSV